jgi:hypothetical protein
MLILCLSRRLLLDRYVGLSTRGYAECVFLTFWDLAVAGGFLTAALAAWASLRSRSRHSLEDAAGTCGRSV